MTEMSAGATNTIAQQSVLHIEIHARRVVRDEREEEHFRPKQISKDNIKDITALPGS